MIVTCVFSRKGLKNRFLKNMYKLTLIIPFYNETDRIQVCLNALTTWRVPRGVVLEQVIFVDDGSKDTSPTVVKRHIPDLKRHLHTQVKLISYRHNRGKGYAIARGMRESDSEYSVFLDADIATPLSELTKMLPAMRQGTDIIVGTRKNGHSTVGVHQPLFRELMGHGFTFLANSLFRTRVTDFTCGFKAFSRRAKDAIFPYLISHRWGFDVEAIFVGKQRGMSLQEVPVRWDDQRGSKVQLSKDIVRTGFELIQVLFAYTIKPMSLSIKPVAVVLDTIKTYVL